MKTYLVLSVLALLMTGCASIENGVFATGLAVERSLSGLEKKQIQLSDHHWHYLEGGDPSLPTVVLLHGFAANKDNWIRMVRHLDGYHVIIPDLPGHGDSSFNGDLYYGFDVQSRRLAEFVDALDLPTFHLVGNSMGGAVAALYAYRHPSQVKTLTLIDAVGFYGEEESELQKRLARNEPNPLIIRDEDGFDAFLDFVLADKPFLPWPAASVLGRQAKAREQANDHIFEHIYAEIDAARYAGGFGHIYAKLEMPALIVWGDKDPVLHVSSVNLFFDYLENAEVNVFSGVGHAPMVERPKQTALLLADFWLRQDSQRAVDDISQQE